MNFNGKKRVISLDLGTASIGWALRERQERASEAEMIGGGVIIFQEGFGTSKSGQFSLAAERRKHRLIRRQYYRRKQRKRVVLGQLVRLGYIPLTMAALRAWTSPAKGSCPVYPQSSEFHRWLRLQPRSIESGDTAFTDIYTLRAAAAKGQLDHFQAAGYTVQELLARVIYNYAQRRGFQSNANQPDDKETGKVKEEISQLRQQMAGRFLAEYLADLNPIQNRLRNRYTDRSMYIEEFEALWAHYGQQLQGLQQDHLHKALFEARPLRSQKDKVGPCTFEPSKRRVRASHPEFEWFRLLQFLQNIRFGKARGEKDLLPSADLLDVAEEILRRHPDTFTKKELEAILSRRMGAQLIVTTDNKFPARACPMASAMLALLGAGWRTRTFQRTYHKGALGMHTATVGYEDIWTRYIDAAERPERFDSPYPLAAYLALLGLPESGADRLRQVQAAQGYAAVSLTAIRRILPWMEQGYPYHIAVCLAGMSRALGPALWQTQGEYIIGDFLAHIDDIPWESAICKTYNALLDNLKQFGEVPDPGAIRKRFAFQLGAKAYKLVEKQEPTRLADALDRLTAWMDMAVEDPERAGFKPAPTYREFMRQRVGDELAAIGMPEAKVQRAMARLYHHAEVSKWKAPRWEKATNGPPGHMVMQLETPYTGAIENPAAMRALHETKKLLNYLLREGMIDAQTTVVVEMGRELNEMNKRTAIQQWQAMLERERMAIRIFLIDVLHEASPTADQEARARLWLEQVAHTEGELERSRLDKQYLSKEFGNNKGDQLVQKLRLWQEQKGICLYSGRQISPADILHGDVQIEHTIPRSLSNDSRMENLTLATGSANRLKANRIPTQLQGQTLGLDAHEVVLRRIRPWEERVEELEKQLRKKSAVIRARKSEGKRKAYDDAIVERWLLRFERDYWADKVRRFHIEEVNEGFARRQLVDMQVITRYAIGWLKTAFNHVRGTKGELTAELRKAWGLQAFHEEKDRTAHNHHFVDAVVNAYIDAGLYNRLAAYYRAVEDKRQSARLAPPWEGFAAWAKSRAEEVLVYHVPRHRFHMQTKRKVKGQAGHFIQGQGVRGSLHKDTALARVEAFGRNKLGDYDWIRDFEGKRKKVFAVRSKIDAVTNPIFGRLADYIAERKAHVNSDHRILPVLRVKLEGGGRIAVSALTLTNLALLAKNPLNAWLLEEIGEKGLFTIQEEGFYLPINKARNKKRVVQAIPAREVYDAFQRRDRPHRHLMYYENDNNYALGIYTNQDGKKISLAFRLVTNIDAGKCSDVELLPSTIEKNGKPHLLDNSYSRKQIYRVGTKALLFESSADEIWNDLTPYNLSKRLYCVRGIRRKMVDGGKNVNHYGTLLLRLHMFAGKLKNEGEALVDAGETAGVFTQEQPPMPIRLMMHTQIKALIEGIDFRIDYFGQVIRL